MNLACGTKLDIIFGVPLLSKHIANICKDYFQVEGELFNT